MEYNGLHYTRIWCMQSPAQKKAGGGCEMPVDESVERARRSVSIHVRVQGEEDESVTLRPGVTWPLDQLRRGLPFDETHHGVDVTPAIARVTWAGTRVDAMWNKGIGSRTRGDTLADGRLYLAFENPMGLHLVAGERCEFEAGTPAPVEVWLGRLPDEALMPASAAGGSGGGVADSLPHWSCKSEA